MLAGLICTAQGWPKFSAAHVLGELAMDLVMARAERALEVLREADALAVEGSVSLATSLSAEDMVITDLIARHNLRIGLFTIDTGMLHAETLAMIVAVKVRYGLAVRVVRPDPATVKALLSRQSAYAFYESLEARHACCHVRKVIPLEEALRQHVGWVTGQRRDAAASRSALEEIENDAVRGIAKFNPLAGWSFNDVMAYSGRRQLPISPLYDRGYRSIGCEPCTRALKPGEDIRAGRWWWEQGSASKECGLHVAEAHA